MQQNKLSGRTSPIYRAEFLLSPFS